jgi:hypothetical protein
MSLTLADRRTLDNLICTACLNGDITEDDCHALRLTVAHMYGYAQLRGTLHGWQR